MSLDEARQRGPLALSEEAADLLRREGLQDTLAGRTGGAGGRADQLNCCAGAEGRRSLSAVARARCPRSSGIPERGCERETSVPYALAPAGT